MNDEYPLVRMPDFTSRRLKYHYVTAMKVLLRLGIDLNRVKLLATGTLENFKGEVHWQEPKAGTEISDRSEISLGVGMLSAVDSLPYQFFYGFEHGPHRSGDWETNARELMAPFDASVIRYQTKCADIVGKFGFGTLDEAHCRYYLKLFGLPEFEGNDLDELFFWIRSLPEFHFWAGNSRAVARVATALIGFPVEIIESVESSTLIPEDCRSKLGEESAVLGTRMILGSQMVDNDNAYEVVVSRVSAAESKGFLPGGKARKKLERILDLCMPNNLERKLTIRTKRSPLKLGDQKKNAHLGYSTYVNAG